MKRKALLQLNRAKCEAGAQGIERAARPSPFNPAERLQDEVDPPKRGLCLAARVNNQRPLLLSHQHQTKGMIDVGVREENAGDWTVARRNAPRLQFRRTLDLPRQVGRSIDQEPAPKAFGVAGNRDTRLRLRRNCSGARGAAVRADTIPLRKATPGRTSENTDANRSTLARSNRAGVAGALEKDRQGF
jgi:hypothetical protein